MWLVAIVIMFFVTRPAPVTSEFDERTARLFSIAVAEKSVEGIKYKRTGLTTAQDRDPALPPVDYRLPETQVTIDEGDIHYVSVLEDHGEWQLIEFRYNNTYMGKSVYRAYADRVEPVSFQMIAHLGQAMMAMLLIVPVYITAWLITSIRNRRAAASARSQ